MTPTQPQQPQQKKKNSLKSVKTVATGILAGTQAAVSDLVTNDYASEDTANHARRSAQHDVDNARDRNIEAQRLKDEARANDDIAEEIARAEKAKTDAAIQKANDNTARLQAELQEAKAMAELAATKNKSAPARVGRKPKEPGMKEDNQVNVAFNDSEYGALKANAGLIPVATLIKDHLRRNSDLLKLKE